MVIPHIISCYTRMQKIYLLISNLTRIKFNYSPKKTVHPEKNGTKTEPFGYYSGKQYPFCKVVSQFLIWCSWLGLLKQAILAIFSRGCEEWTKFYQSALRILYVHVYDYCCMHSQNHFIWLSEIHLWSPQVPDQSIFISPLPILGSSSECQL